jgi:hypothetical protein
MLGSLLDGCRSKIRPCDEALIQFVKAAVTLGSTMLEKLLSIEFAAEFERLALHTAWPTASIWLWLKFADPEKRPKLTPRLPCTPDCLKELKSEQNCIWACERLELAEEVRNVLKRPF